MKAFVATLMATAASAVAITDSSYNHSDETTYYEDHTYTTHNPIFFHREVPVRIIEKYYHAHSDASQSSEVDSYASDYDSFLSDECGPWAYDCTDSSDYSKHSSDDSAGVSSHDHDHGFYGYDYFASDSEHYDDLHAHYRETERYEKVPEVYLAPKLTYVKVPNKKTEVEAVEEEVLPYGHADVLVETKADPWPGTDPYPNLGKYLGREWARYVPRDGVDGA